MEDKRRELPSHEDYSPTQINEYSSGSNGGVGIAWFGVVIVSIGNRLSFIWDYWLVMSIIGIVLTVAGCALWAQRKNRHWVFCFWGLLAPIGFLGISLLKDRSKDGKK